MNIDFGHLTAEETIGVAIEAMNYLTLEQKIEVVKQMFRNADDKAELIAELED